MNMSTTHEIIERLKLGSNEFGLIVKRILEHADIGHAELLNRIWKKYNELGVVTLEGAAGLVGKELGVDVDE